MNASTQPASAPASMRQPDRDDLIFGMPKLVLSLMPLAFYQVFAPVWAPDVTSLRYDQARVLQLALLSAIVAMMFMASVRQGVVEAWLCLPRLPRLLIAVFVVSGALSAAFSASIQLGALELASAAQMLFLFLCVAAAVRRDGAAAERVLATATVTGAGLVILQFWLTQCLTALEGRPFSWVSPFLEFANVRFFNQYQAYALLLLTLPLVILRLPVSWRLLVYLIAANFWALQWMLGARAVWVGVLSASAAVIIFGSRGRMRWLAGQAALLLAGGALFLLLSGLQNEAPAGGSLVPKKLSMLDRGWQSVSERTTMARSALELLASKPLLGVGPGQYGLHYTKTRAAHPHNSALQLLSEYGLLGGGAAIGLGLSLLVLAIRKIRRRDRSFDPVDTALAGALILGLTDSIFSGNLTMPHSQILLCLIAGWLVGRNGLQSTASSHPHTARVEATVLVVIVILAACISVALSVKYILAVNTLPEWLPERFPHFWQYGRWGDW